MPWTKLLADAERFAAPSLVEGSRLLTYREALLEAQTQAMEADPNVLVMGEGVDDPGGSFGTTLGLQERFGAERVFDLPLAENTGTGTAVGAALVGMRPIIVHLRVDFTLLAMDQIANHAAKYSYMFDGRHSVPLVIRSIVGRGWGSAAQHSQSLQGLFQHIPGLKVVMPSGAYDAKGLLLGAIAENAPIMFIEHRWLYDMREHTPQEMYTVPFGRASVRKEGADVTIAAVSFMVPEAYAAAQELAEEGVDVELLDMRCIKPMDKETLAQSLAKTGRLVIADTGNVLGGWSAEAAAFAAEELFGFLKSPVARVGLPDVPTPASPVLEAEFYPDKEDIKAAVKRVINYKGAFA